MSKDCVFADCLRLAITKGMCPGHYQQSRSGDGSLRKLRVYRGKLSGSGKCLVESCAKPVASRLLCQRHASVCNRHHMDQVAYADMHALGCSNTLCGQSEFLQVDHDHTCCEGANSCGKCIRGLLCRDCNRFAAIADRVRDTRRLAGVLKYIQEQRPDLPDFQRIYQGSVGS